MGSDNRLDAALGGNTISVKKPLSEDEERLLQAYRETDDRGRALIMASAEIISNIVSGTEGKE